MKQRNLKLYVTILLCLSLFGCQIMSKTNKENTSGAGSINFNTPITYNGDGIDLNNNIVTIHQGGRYEISGESHNGQIIVDAAGQDVELIFDHLNLTCQNSSPLIVLEANLVTINIVNDSTLTDTGNYILNNVGANAVIYSKQKLVLKGTASLNINANYQNAIESKNDLIIQSGKYTIHSLGNGIVSKDQVTIENGEYIIDSKLKAIMCGNFVAQNGTFDITSKQNSIQAKSIDINQGNWQVESLAGGLISSDTFVMRDGTYTFNTQQNSMEAKQLTIHQGSLLLNSKEIAIKSEECNMYGGTLKVENSKVAIASTRLTVNDGTLSLFSTEEGIQIRDEKEGGDCQINNGNIIIDSGTYGIDIQGIFAMNGGTLYVNGSTSNKLTALHSTKGYKLNGGIFCSLDVSQEINMPLNDSTQVGMILSLNQVYPTGTSIMIKDANDSNVFEYTSLKAFQTIHLSSYKLTLGDTYYVYINNTRYCEITMSSAYSSFIY